MTRNTTRHTTRQVAAWLGALLLALTLAVGPGPVWAASSPGAGASAPTSGVRSNSGKVNVNTASTDELQLLPGVGESRARAIIEMRKRSGGFKSVDQLVEVKGIGSTLLERLRPHVTLTGKTTAQRRK